MPDPRKLNVALVGGGIAAVVVGALLFIPQTCTSFFGFSYCYAPYLGAAVGLIIVGTVLFVVALVLHLLADEGAVAVRGMPASNFCRNCAAAVSGFAYCPRCGQPV